MSQTVVLKTSGVSAADVIAVARHGARVEISAESVAAMAVTRKHIEALATGETPVGVDAPDSYWGRSVSIMLPEGTPWVEGAADALRPYEGALR